LGLDGSVSDGVNCRGFSAEENRGFTKVSIGGTEAGLWSTDGGRKDIDPETVRATRAEHSRRFLRELDEAPGGNNLQYIY